MIFKILRGILKNLRILIFKALPTSQNRTYENAIWQGLFCYQVLFIGVSTETIKLFLMLMWTIEVVCFSLGTPTLLTPSQLIPSKAVLTQVLVFPRE